MAGAASMFSFTTFRRPACSRPRSSTAGVTIRHGAHHGAQKSTSTGTVASIAASKSSAETSTIHGSASWQLPQRGVPPAATGRRFFFPQFGQVTICASAIVNGSRPKRGGVQPAFVRSALAPRRSAAPEQVDGERERERQSRKPGDLEDELVEVTAVLELGGDHERAAHDSDQPDEQERLDE